MDISKFIPCNAYLPFIHPQKNSFTIKNVLLGVIIIKLTTLL